MHMLILIRRKKIKMCKIESFIYFFFKTCDAKVRKHLFSSRIDFIKLMKVGQNSNNNRTVLI